MQVMNTENEKNIEQVMRTAFREHAQKQMNKENDTLKHETSGVGRIGDEVLKKNNFSQPIGGGLW